MRNQFFGFMLEVRNIRLLVLAILAALSFIDWVAALSLGLGFLLVAISWDKVVADRAQLLNHVQVALVILLLLPLALLGFAISTNGLLSLLVEHGIGQRLPMLFAYCLGLASCAWLAIKSVSRINDRLFLVCVLMLALILRLAYALIIDIVQESDFSVMAMLAEQLVRNDMSVASLDPAPNTIFLERVLFYLVPFHLLLPRTEWVIPGANIVFTLGSLWLLHGITRGLFHHPVVARVAVVFAAFIPESIMLVLVASHDVPGAFWILAHLCLVVKLLQGPMTSKQVVGFSVLLAATFFFAEIQRTVGVFLFVFDVLVVAGALIAVRSVNRRFQLVAIVVCSVVLAVSAINLFRSAFHEILPDRGDHLVTNILAHSEPGTDGSWAYWVLNWSQREIPQEPEAYAVKRMAAGFVLNPFDYTAMLVRKTHRLVLLGSQHNFNLHAAKLSGHPLSFDERRIIYQTISLFASFFWLLLIGGIMLTVSGAGNRILPAFLMLVYVMPLLLMLELQPRFMYVIWFLGAPYVAATMLRMVSKENNLEPARLLEH